MKNFKESMERLEAWEKMWDEILAPYMVKKNPEEEEKEEQKKESSNPIKYASVKFMDKEQTRNYKLKNNIDMNTKEKNNMNKYLFTSEAVSEGHPDKVADRISDALLDHIIYNNRGHGIAGIETLVTTNRVVLSGEIHCAHFPSKERIDALVRNTVRRIGYTHRDLQFDADSLEVENYLHEQSPQLTANAVQEEPGAGDQGMMFGYAVNETDVFMPLPLYLAQLIMKTYDDIRHEGKEMTYLRPDAKCQVTVEYEGKKPIKIDTIVISCQHADTIGDEETARQHVSMDVIMILIPRMLSKITDEKIRRLFDNDIKFVVNPVGKFVVGGPHGDTGLTGRKIIVDTYGGRGAHGGGAFSGKDATKVDRSAAYEARHIAKNLVAAGVADEVLIQISYAIGVSEPVSIFVDTYGTSKRGYTDAEIADIIKQNIKLTPLAIRERLCLNSPIYEKTATYGHFGRTPKEHSWTIRNGENSGYNRTYYDFSWERLDYVDEFKKLFENIEK